jgi:CO/xanthine dehydrogenase Mo-binding subunit
VFVESIDPFNAFGQKGVGETSMTSQIPAILNTVANATGVRIYQTPVTPEVVLKALGKI